MIHNNKFIFIVIYVYYCSSNFLSSNVNMRKLNIEDLKKEFVGKTFNWLTVLDVFIEKMRLRNIF